MNVTTFWPWPTVLRWIVPEIEAKLSHLLSEEERLVFKYFLISNISNVWVGDSWLGWGCGQDVQGPKSQADNQSWHGLWSIWSTWLYSSKLDPGLWCGAPQLPLISFNVQEHQIRITSFYNLLLIFISFVLYQNIKQWLLFFKAIAKI